MDAIISSSDLATQIEFWFPFSEIELTRRLGTWCDGIPLLHVRETNRLTFSISGVGFFPHQLAPFETEWNFQHRRDAVPKTVILRLGHVHHEKQQSSLKNKHPDCLYRSRPKKNSDWMVAVELFEPRR